MAKKAKARTFTRNRYYKDAIGRWRVIPAGKTTSKPSKKPARCYLDKSGRERCPKTGKLVPKRGKVAAKKRAKRLGYKDPVALLRRVTHHVLKETGVDWEESMERTPDWFWEYQSTLRISSYAAPAYWREVANAFYEAGEDPRIVNAKPNLNRMARLLVTVEDDQNQYYDTVSGPTAVRLDVALSQLSGTILREWAEKYKDSIITHIETRLSEEKRDGEKEKIRRDLAITRDYKKRWEREEEYRTLLKEKKPKPPLHKSKREKRRKRKKSR